MSMIDCFKHEVIGYSKNGVPLYRLLQDIPTHIEDFQGKTGDILLGGGGGETSAIGFSMPEAIKFVTDFENFFPNNIIFLGGITKCFWSPTESYLYCREYIDLGWNPDEMPIETWLNEHLIAFLVKNYNEYYKDVLGKDNEFDCDGSIFTLNEL